MIRYLYIKDERYTFAFFNTLAENIEKRFFQHVWYERGRKMAVVYSRAKSVDTVLQCPFFLKENLGVLWTV
jgi:hypothetical protein